jgi:uncharacterized phosphosugar-binding protein
MAKDLNLLTPFEVWQKPTELFTIQSRKMFSPAPQKLVSETQRVLEHYQSQTDQFELIAGHIYKSLSCGGILHVFGSGHSHSIAEELFHRAGGLVPVNPLFEPTLMPHSGPRTVGPTERLSGFASVIINSHDLQKGEVILIASNSGINAVPVEMAELAKEKGLFTVGITSITHSKNVPSRSKNQKKLFEVVDALIDIGSPKGDACVEIKTSQIKVAPLSGISTLIAAELLVCRICEIYSENHQKPPVYQSANTPGGDEHNKKLEEIYRPRIKSLN